MWECSFAGETMDYKLFWLRFAKKIWIIIAATILGALVVGVPYYLVNITFGPDPSYKVVSEYYLDYAEDANGKTYDYYNFYTWGEVAKTDEFVGILQSYLPKEVSFDADTLRSYTDATVESDTRYLFTEVVTEDAETSLTIARAMEKAVAEFGNIRKEFQDVKIITSPQTAEETYPDVRPVRAIVVGILLGFVTGLIGVCVYIITDSSVYLPNVMEKRYQIKALGCLSFSESKNNVCYAMKDCKNAAVLWVDHNHIEKGEEAAGFIENALKESCEVSLVKQEVLAPDFDFDAVRKKDAVVLMVAAGNKNGKKIERIVEQLRRQDIGISGAFLYNEDKKLMKHYYR